MCFPPSVQEGDPAHAGGARARQQLLQAGLPACLGPLLRRPASHPEAINQGKSPPASQRCASQTLQQCWIEADLTSSRKHLVFACTKLKR